MAKSVVCMVVGFRACYTELLWLLLSNGCIGGYLMTIAERVEAILANVPATRNSDTELLIIYMQKAGMNLSAEQQRLFKEMPSVGTVRRVRRKLQEQGKYPASDEVKRERSHKAMVMQQNIPKLRGEQAVKHIEETLDIKVLPWGK